MTLNIPLFTVWLELTSTEASIDVVASSDKLPQSFLDSMSEAITPAFDKWIADNPAAQLPSKDDK